MNPRAHAPKGTHFSYDRIARVLKVITTKPCTSRQLARSAVISETAARNIVRALYAHKVIYVESYARNRGYRLGARVFAIGAERDAPRPPRMTAAERQRRYRQKRATLEGAWPAQLDRRPA